MKRKPKAHITVMFVWATLGGILIGFNLGGYNTIFRHLFNVAFEVSSLYISFLVQANNFCSHRIILLVKHLKNR